MGKNVSNVILMKSFLLTTIFLNHIHQEFLNFEFEVKDGFIDLYTDRIFLNRTTLNAATNAKTALTYIANNLRHDTNATPYSMITGVSNNFFD